MFLQNKILLGIVVNFVLTFYSLLATSALLKYTFTLQVLIILFIARQVVSLFFFSDYRLSWSKASTKTGLVKSLLGIITFAIYAPILFFLYNIHFSYLCIELVIFLFVQNTVLYLYKYYHSVNGTHAKKTKFMVIYGAGVAGVRLSHEYSDSEYKVLYFIDDDKSLHSRSIDGIRIISREKLLKDIDSSDIDLLVIAMPSIETKKINSIYDELKDYFKNIKILPSRNSILNDEAYSTQLKDISVEDLLARHPKDLDKETIKEFISNKTVLITGAGGSIGSEIARQSLNFKAKKLILLDHSEFNLYSITEELQSDIVIPVLQSVLNRELLEKTVAKHSPDIIIHAAAYKHVPLVESNIQEAILNNIIGTKNSIDLAIKYGVKKFVLISTDKAVRPTNMMGSTKRVCELYAQNVLSKETEIVSVRFGNVLGSSGSVIPKFREQIKNNQDITVTHPNITRYFMLIPEACELVLQAASLGKGGELFILDMGEPIKIVNLAKKMIDISGKKEIKIKFTGLRAGEKLYEELLINDNDHKTKYESITVAKSTFYDITELLEDINNLITGEDKIKMLNKIVPEFNHNNGS